MFYLWNFSSVLQEHEEFVHGLWKALRTRFLHHCLQELREGLSRLRPGIAEGRLDPPRGFHPRLDVFSQRVRPSAFRHTDHERLVSGAPCHWQFRLLDNVLDLLHPSISLLAWRELFLLLLDAPHYRFQEAPIAAL